MNFKPFSQLYAFLFVLTLLACQSENSASKESPDQTLDTTSKEEAISTNFAVKPPLENIDVVYQEFTIQQNQAQTIALDNGSSIEIPAQAFVTKTGEPVETPVTIAYREFHSPAEIITSGIPMHVTNEDGETEWMQTAGMFEIKGFAEGSEIFIADGKEVKINMASEVDGVYDFWYLDNEQQNWTRQGSAATSPNANAVASASANVTSVKQPIKPVAFDQNKPSLNFDLNYNAFPELKDLQGIVWQYAGNNQEKDPANNEWIFDENWTDIQLDRAATSGIYQLQLTSDKKDYSIPVRPGLKDLDYARSMEKYRQELVTYRAVIADMQAMRDQQAEFIRSMRISRFGIHNYDIMWKVEAAIPLVADFDFGNYPEELKDQITVYLITGNRRTVVSYPRYDWKKFAFDPTQDNSLMAILPGNLIATFGQQDFDEQLEAMKEARSKVYKFEMKVRERPVETVAAVSKAIL